MGGVAVAQGSSEASYKLNILEWDGGVVSTQRTWPPKVCTKLCFSFFLSVHLWMGLSTFLAGKVFYVFMFSEAVPVDTAKVE